MEIHPANYIATDNLQRTSYVWECCDVETSVNSLSLKVFSTVYLSALLGINMLLSSEDISHVNRVMHLRGTDAH